MTLRTVRDLLSNDDLAALWDAPVIATGRHPTWYPVFSPRPIDHVSNQAVSLISDAGGDDWLGRLAPRFSRIDDPEEAAAALAELRAYGGLLEAGFSVIPIAETDESTPDFEADAGDGAVIVEVFAKHQDESENRLWKGVTTGQTPAGVERNVVEDRRGKIETTTMEMRPGGAPDPAKPHDSVQANLISRICAAKGNEKQFPSDCPSLLWIDLRSFGGWPEALKVEQCTPLVSGRDGLTSGAFWYAFFGWKDAPIFEEDFPLHEQVVRMGHDGRFRLQGTKKSKLSGAILVLWESLVLFENPWADHPLPDRARRFAERLPWFDFGHSICNWSRGDAEKLAELGRRQIEALNQWRTSSVLPDGGRVER
jgi:hypothetical protein